MDVEIKISDDGFQTKHQLTNILCTCPEPYYMPRSAPTKRVNLDLNWRFKKTEEQCLLCMTEDKTDYI